LKKSINTFKNNGVKKYIGKKMSEKNWVFFLKKLKKYRKVRKNYTNYTQKIEILPFSFCCEREINKIQVSQS